MTLFEELKLRGLIKDMTSPKVESLINEGRAVFYCGFDPTADSLHVGSLLPLITMKRLQNHGNKAIALVGGCTGLIGDPSFKSQERCLLSKEQMNSNLQGISKNIQNIISCEMVNNLDWFSSMSVIDFLRDVGKHFTVNNMLSKDSVKSRLEDRDQGISFTEFSYMLLQGQDFKHLFEKHGCNLQVGGSDQFTNILGGIDLIRKTLQKEAFGFTIPLLVKSDGVKFGKSEKGNVWLSPEKTSPFDFFQFFFRVEDADVIDLLKKMTFLSLEEIGILEQSLKSDPQLRKAQKALAMELTKIVHGQDVLSEVLQKTDSLFGSKDLSIPDEEREKSLLIGIKILDLLVELGLSSSKTMAKKDIQGNAISLNGKRIIDINKTISQDDIENGVILFQKGKKNFKVIKAL